MSLFADSQFFICAAIFAIISVIIGLKGRSQKYIGFIASAFFVFMAMKEKPIALVYLVIFLAFQWLLVTSYLAIVKKYGKKQSFYWLYIFLSLAFLIIYKLTSLAGKGILGFIGISYVTFRSVQMILEIYDGLIKEVKLFDFLYYMIFFPCLLAGPIDRSQRFEKDIYRILPRQEYLEKVGKGIETLLLGVVYKFIFGGLAFAACNHFRTITGIENQLVYMYTYGIYMFFDFAGYSYMAIGMGSFFGIDVPRNFNAPFIAVDIKDFWDRWHITLSHWFRDYLFSRLMMRATKAKWFGSKLTRASIIFMINMTVMGVWHGLTLDYIVYGLYHGVLLAITEVYQKKSKFHKKHKKDKWYKFFSWLITINLVMFGFYIFSGRCGVVLQKLIIKYS